MVDLRERVDAAQGHPTRPVGRSRIEEQPTGGVTVLGVAVVPLAADAVVEVRFAPGALEVIERRP